MHHHKIIKNIVKPKKIKRFLDIKNNPINQANKSNAIFNNTVAIGESQDIVNQLKGLVYKTDEASQIEFMNLAGRLQQLNPSASFHFNTGEKKQYIPFTKKGYDSSLKIGDPNQYNVTQNLTDDAGTVFKHTPPLATYMKGIYPNMVDVNRTGRAPLNMLKNSVGTPYYSELSENLRQYGDFGMSVQGLQSTDPKINLDFSISRAPFGQIKSNYNGEMGNEHNFLQYNNSPFVIESPTVKGGSGTGIRTSSAFSGLKMDASLMNANPDFTGTFMKFINKNEIPEARYNSAAKSMKDYTLLEKQERGPIYKLDYKVSDMLTEPAEFYPIRKQEGGAWEPKMQLGGVTRRLAKTFGNTPSLLPKPSISTIPYTKRIGFNQIGQIIPQQHMTSGKYSGNSAEAINHIYNDGPMWFAPTGDRRYVDHTMDSEFVSGLGKSTQQSFIDFTGNTGKKGFDEFPFTELEKLKKGFGNEYHQKVVDGKLVPDFTKPIMRTEGRFTNSLQNKIEGVFNPDSKIKIIYGKPSRLGHSLEGNWDDTKIGKWMDEGYDIVQVINEFTGEQLENILLPNSKHKFKVTKIDDMEVDIDNPEFRRGGNIPQAQMGGSLGKFVFNNSSNKLLNKSGLLKVSNVDNFLTKSGFSKNQKAFFTNTLNNNPDLLQNGLIDATKWKIKANENVAKMNIRDVVDQKQNPYSTKSLSFNDGMDGLGVHGYHNMGDGINIKPQLLHFTMPDLLTSSSGVDKSLGAHTSGYASDSHDMLKVHGDGTFGWARGFENPNDKSQFLLTELQNDLGESDMLKMLKKAYAIKDPELRAAAVKKLENQVSLNNPRNKDMNLINDLRVELNMYEDIIDTKVTPPIDINSGEPYHTWEIEQKIELVKKNIAAAQKQMVNFDLVRGSDNLQLTSILNNPYKRQQSEFLNYLGTKGYTSLGIPDPQTVSYIQDWGQSKPDFIPETIHAGGVNTLTRNGWDDLGLGKGSEPSQGRYGRLLTSHSGTDKYYKDLLRSIKKDVNISDIGKTELGKFKWNTLKNIGGKDFVPFKQNGGQPKMETASIYDMSNKDGAYDDQNWFTKANHGFSENVYNNAQTMNMNAAPAFGGLGKAVKTGKILDYGKQAYDGIKNWMSDTPNSKIAGTPEGTPSMNMGKYGGQTEGYALNRVPDGVASDNSYEVGGQVYRKTAGSSYQEGGSTDNTRNRFETFVQEQESSWDYIKNKNSAILKPDGKTYYKIFEGDKFYPYYHENTDGTFEKTATIGFGRKGEDVFDDYKKGINLETAEDWRSDDIDNSLRKTKLFINSNYGDDAYDKLTENEKFMLTDYTYNLGKLSKYPSFADAIVNKDVDKAMLEYIRNDKPTSEGGKPLARNKAYLDQWLQPWINKTNKKTEETISKQLKDNAMMQNLIKESNPIDNTYVAPPVFMPEILEQKQEGGSTSSAYESYGGYDNYKKMLDYQKYQTLLAQKENMTDKEWENAVFEKMTFNEIEKNNNFSKMSFGDARRLARDMSDIAFNMDGNFEGKNKSLMLPGNGTDFKWNNQPYSIEADDDDISEWRNQDQLSVLLSEAANSGDLESMINDGTLETSEDIYNYLIKSTAGNRGAQRVLESAKENFPNSYLDNLGLNNKSQLVNKLRTDRGITTGAIDDTNNTDEVSLINNTFTPPAIEDYNYNINPAESTGTQFMNQNLVVEGKVPPPEEAPSRLVDAYLMSDSYNKGTQSFEDFAKTFNTNETKDFNTNYVSQYFGDDVELNEEFSNYTPGKVEGDEGYNELFESINLSKNSLGNSYGIGNQGSNFELPGGIWSSATQASLSDYGENNMPEILSDRREQLLKNKYPGGAYTNSDFSTKYNRDLTWKEKNIDKPWDNFYGQSTNAFVNLPASIIDWGGDIIDGGINTGSRFFTGNNIPGMTNNQFTRTYDNPTENNMFWSGLDIASLAPQGRLLSKGLKAVAGANRFTKPLVRNTSAFKMPNRKVLFDGVNLKGGLKKNYNTVMGNMADDQVYNKINQLKNEGLFKGVTGSTKYTMPSGKVVNLNSSNLQFNPNALRLNPTNTSAFANPSNYKWPAAIGAGIAMESNTTPTGLNSQPIYPTNLNTPRQTFLKKVK
tara:strand:- start:72384 stop:78653 length:6270 start_codon:yes stop_codon:yes gene_type:complete